MGRTSDAKEHLIETTLELIWDNSYHSVGVKAICEKAGVKPGSFYYFFPSKRDLALAALEFHWKEVKERILEPSFSPDIPPQERISILFDKVYAFHAGRQKEGKPVSGCVFGSVVGELGKQDGVIRKRIQKILSGIGIYFEKALSDSVSSGALDIKKAKIPETAQAILAYYEGVALLARAQNNAEVFRNLTPYVRKITS